MPDILIPGELGTWGKRWKRPHRYDTGMRILAEQERMELLGALGGTRAEQEQQIQARPGVHVHSGLTSNKAGENEEGSPVSSTLDISTAAHFHHRRYAGVWA